MKSGTFQTGFTQVERRDVRTDVTSGLSASAYCILNPHSAGCTTNVFRAVLDTPPQAKPVRRFATSPAQPNAASQGCGSGYGSHTLFARILNQPARPRVKVHYFGECRWSRCPGIVSVRPELIEALDKEIG